MDLLLKFSIQPIVELTTFTLDESANADKPYKSKIYQMHCPFPIDIRVIVYASHCNHINKQPDTYECPKERVLVCLPTKFIF
jgi:hypothetical protein